MTKSRKTNAKDNLRWQLGERVKELKALHRTALTLNRPGRSVARTMRILVMNIPRAWQYPEITVVKISWAGETYASPDYKKTRWNQTADIKVAPGQAGVIEICYLEARPRAFRGPFLKEEVLLLNSLAVMIKTYLQNRIYQEHQATAKYFLERQIKKRTLDLTQANRELRLELALGRRRERQIKIYQGQLKSLAQKLATAEDRERREIATDLHDHIGQGLAMINLKLQTLQGNSVFSGQERDIEEIKNLTRQAVKYTRNLTFELSPLVVYELDFGAALQWLADHFGQKYELQVEIHNAGRPSSLSEDMRIMLFKSVRELLTNAVKHGKASRAGILVKWLPQGLEITVKDNGAGFVSPECGSQTALKGFGLFNIKERAEQYKGRLEVDSRPGKGCSVTINLATATGIKA